MKLNFSKTRVVIFFKLCSYLCVIALVLSFLYMQGYRINLSGSLPYWFFKVSVVNDKIISRGDYVIVDYSLIKDNPIIETALDRKYLNRQLPMGKQIGAVSGDIILLKDDRFFVNGEDLGYMKVLSADSRGDPLFPFPTPEILQSGQYWLISNPERGFDSRYFGYVDISCIIYIAYPVF